MKTLPQVPISAAQPTRRPRASHSRRAFTLIELLIIIVIISLLAAILFPAFGRAREMGRRSSCASNLKQIGLGFAQYCQDNSDFYPGCYMGNFGSSNSRWMDSIYPYVKSAQLFTCPSDTDVTHVYTGNRGVLNLAAATPTGFGSYASNQAYWGNQFSGNSSNGYEWSGPMSGAQNQFNSTAAVYSPATTLLVAEGTGSFQCAWQWSTGGQGQPTGVDITTDPATIHQPSPITNMEGAIVSRHLGTTNVLFCDGHVKALSLTNLLEKSGNPPTNVGTAGLRYFTRWDD